MGCDIHAHLEIKVAGAWHHYTVVPLERAYALFAKMAGVRLDEPAPIVPPRGMPPGLSLVTRLGADKMGSDGHTHSWLTAAEVGEVQHWHEEAATDSVWKQWGFLFGNSIGGWAKYRDEYPAEIEDVRLVFWFDN